MLGVCEVRKQLQYIFTEAGYSEITEIYCEILFICAILLFMEVIVQYPVILHVDNVGDILLS